jgi:hypothetical protein
LSVQPKDKSKPITEKVVPQVTAHGSDDAPFVYFDGPVAFGFVGNVVQIELGASVCVPVTINGKTEVRNRTVVVGHLRASHAVMAALADAIEKALMLTGPLPGVEKKEKNDA